MSASPSTFSSVKLPSGLVSQAREAATPMRRSVAGQIEYWATLGRIAEASGLTITEAREAIALYDVRQTTTVSAADPLDAIEAEAQDWLDALLREFSIEHLRRSPALRDSLLVAVVGGPSGSGLAHPEHLDKLASSLGISDVVRFAPPARHDAPPVRACPAIAAPHLG